MPRHARVLLTGQPHHVVQRGHDQRLVFASDADYLFYLANLAEQLEKLSIGVYAWCLMTNHVHLLLEPLADGDAISQLMRVLSARYTRHVNRLEGRSGTQWDGRFHCSLVDRAEYLWACSRYIDLNPLRAGMVQEPAAYRWSSFRARVGTATRPVFDLPLLPLGEGASYVEYVCGGGSLREDARLRAAVRRNQVTGSRRFVAQIEARLGRRLSRRPPGRPPRDDAGLWSGSVPRPD